MTSEERNTVSTPTMVNRTNLFAIQRDSVNNGLSAKDICTLFDEFLIEFERMEKSGVATTNMFLDAVEEIADTVLLILPHKLLDPTVLSHPLMQFLRQMLIDILDNWQAYNLRLNIQETDIFLKIVLIFVHAAEESTASNPDDDRTRIRDLIATKKLLSLIREQIIDSNRHKNGINDDPNICTLALLTIKLLKGCPFYYSVEQNEHLIDSLVFNSLDSYDYIQAVRQLQYGRPLTDIDRFLLYTCWEYIPFVSTTPRHSNNISDWTNLLQHTYHELLTRLEQSLNEPPPTEPAALTYIFQRCHQLLNIPNLPSFDKHADSIIDRLTTILQNSLTTNTNDEVFIIIALEAFYNLCQNNDIRAIMEKRHLTSLFTKYTSTENDKIRKLAFSILAQIIHEQEINNIPKDILTVFIDQLKQLNPNGFNPEDDNALSSLKVLMQHDQMKDEFIKQGGLETVISFIRDGDPNKQSDNQVEDALKTLWSCTFHNPEALDTLKHDEKFIVRVNQLLESAKKSGNSSLEKAAEGVIWKVEKEEKFKEEQAAEAERKKQEKKRKAQESGKQEDEDTEEEKEEEQYDLMISYSWADMDLVHRIAKHLTEKLGYKIWLDQEQMHGSTIQAMANAVESAQFILMCMSETYKRSANCQSEAEYAFNRKKHIVPCKMKEGYTPDGWLGFILGSRMYIDFGKFEFEKAIDQLHHEIQLQKKKRKDAKAMAKAEDKAAASSENKIDASEELESGQRGKNVKGKMNKISNWNGDDVRNFLKKHKLSSMVLLCNGIEGEDLLNLYEMCKSNSVSMYRSLKFELLHGYNRILPISTYLRFISCMRAACDDGLPSNVHTIKKPQEDYLLDDE